MYYSECYEKDKDYIENNLPRESLTPKLFVFSSKVLKAIIIMKKTQIRYLELERVTLTPYDICIMQNLNNLESLILVNCILPSKNQFFAKLCWHFLQLKVLKIIGFKLTEVFFNNLGNMKIEYLDLSYSFYKRYLYELLPWNENDALRGLRIDCAKLGYTCTNLLIKSRNLEYLSMRHLDFSNFKTKCDTLSGKKYLVLDLAGIFSQKQKNFFLIGLEVENLSLEYLDSIKLKNIHEQNTLHSFTKKLNPSRCRLDSCIVNFLSKF
ncbi:hypothetical protein LUQ84_001441 [Hamiltosporidium tvaerminnensis]|nr:hypothetical protein LUQ84_001441 [Hamiltosporidium tvaerminnensis]